MVNIRLAKEIPGKRLEMFLLASAGEVGLFAVSTDIFTERISSEGGVLKPSRNHFGNSLELYEPPADRKRFKIGATVQSAPFVAQFRFYTTRMPWGDLEYCGDLKDVDQSSKLKEFLAAVNKRVESYQPPQP